MQPGDHHYRAYVGPPEDYDLLGGTQFALLFALGLREHHQVCDVGCGSLRAGRLLIPYLQRGHYCGVDPNPWLVDHGISEELGRSIRRVKRPRFSRRDDFDLGSFGNAFDFVLAQSVFSHTYSGLAQHALDQVQRSLSDTGVLVATFFETADDAPCPRGLDGSGWEYPDVVSYSWPEFRDLATASHLDVLRISWPHPRQAWVLAGRDIRRLDALDRMLTAFPDSP